MEKPKTFIKIATFYLPIYLLFFFISFLTIPLLSMLTRSLTPGFVYFGVLILLHVLAIVDLIYLLIYYLKDVSRNRKIPENQRFGWRLVIFFGNVIAFPIYWNKFIKK